MAYMVNQEGVVTGHPDQSLVLNRSSLAQLSGGNQKAVELTEEGRRFCQAAVVPLRQAEIQAFARLTIEERQTFLSLYRIQLDYLQEEVQKIPRFEA